MQKTMVPVQSVQEGIDTKVKVWTNIC